MRAIELSTCSEKFIPSSHRGKGPWKMAAARGSFIDAACRRAGGFFRINSEPSIGHNRSSNGTTSSKRNLAGLCVSLSDADGAAH